MNEAKVALLQQGIDPTGEVPEGGLKNVKIDFTTDPEKLRECRFIVVAEAAKVIENTQRDVNIALMNELSIIFHRLGIDTLEVLRAAGSKWNFLKFFPGLVGGHCIGVDPYYLTYKAEELGYHPEVILSGRRINDSMGKFVAENTVKKLIKVGKAVNPASLNQRLKLLLAKITIKI